MLVHAQWSHLLKVDLKAMRLFLSIILLVTAGGLMAQGHQQTVRGTIADGDTRQPMFGATE